MSSLPKGELKAEVKTEAKLEPKEQRESKTPNPVQQVKPSTLKSSTEGELKAEVKTDIKLEAKEQRDSKTPNHTPQEKPSSPKGSPGSERKDIKENGPKKESSSIKTPGAAKAPEQKSLPKKDMKEASTTVKKETASTSPPSSPQLPKSPNLSIKAEKKDVPVGEKTASQQTIPDIKSSSPEKNNAKKMLPEKTVSSSVGSSTNTSTKPQEPKDITSSNKVGLVEATSSTNNKNSKQDSSNNKLPDNSKPETKNQEKIANGKNQPGASVKTQNGQSLKPANSEHPDNNKVKQEPVQLKNSSKPENDKGSEKVAEDPLIMKKPASDSSEKSTGGSDKTGEKEMTEQSSDKNNNQSVELIKEDESQSKTSVQKNDKRDSKNQFRWEIWNKMFRTSMLAFRKPCNYRIPHFKGDVISAGRLSTMDIFKKAKVVKVSLDKAHECVRLQVIEAGKEMIVGCPGLREAVFLHVKPPMEPSKSSNKLASSRIGIGHIGTALDFSSDTQADLVIVGSVAVDKTGLRVGKGEGFADLEYALLKKLGGIAPDAPIITVVHDSQVYDTLPEDVFRDHDVPADYIVTPSEVIEINPKRNHPELKWSLLSNRRVNSIPIIKQLLFREQNCDGADICLKDEDTDSEELEQIAKRKRYFMRRRTCSNGSQRGWGQVTNRPNTNRGEVRGRTRRHTAPSETTYQQPMMMLPNRPTRTFRSRAALMPRYNFFPQNMKQNGYWVQRNFQNGGRQRNNRFQMFRSKYIVDFSLKVKGLTNEIRVRDLKAAIKQRGIQPRDISWFPHKGVAFLHFARPKSTTADPQQVTPMSRDTDSVLASLKDLIVKAENGPETNVKVEAAHPLRKVHFTV